MGRASAADALRAVLTRQFGASARQLIDAEVDSRLAGRRTVQREDLDAVEQAVLVALHRDRPLGSTLPKPATSSAAIGSPLRLLTAAASAPALLSLTRPAPWAGDCAHIQGKPCRPANGSNSSFAQSFPSAAAPSIPGTPLPAMDATASSWARSTLRQAAPVPPKKKEPDHFDLMLAYTDLQYNQGEAQAQIAKKNKLAAFAAGLAVQVEERRQKQEREAAEAAIWRQVIQSQAEQHELEIREKEKKAAERLQEMKREAAESNETVERRKQELKKELAKEQEQLDRVLIVEKRHAESQASRKMEVHHKRANDAHDSLAETARFRHSRREADQEETKRFTAEAKCRAEVSEASGNAGYKTRQVVVDALEPYGRQIVDESVKKERFFEERDNLHVMQRTAKDWKTFYDKQEAMRRSLRNTSDTNVRLAAEVRSVRGVTEKEAGLKQRELWEKQDAEHHLKMRLQGEAKRRVRETIDDELLQTMRSNASVHSSLLGVTDAMREREMSYNRQYLGRMAADGFQTELSEPLVMQAAELSATMKTMRGTLKRR